MTLRQVFLAGGSAVSAVTAWLARHSAGISHSPVVRGGATPPVTAGVSVALAPARLLSTVVRGLSLTGRYSGSTTGAHSTGLSLGSRLTAVPVLASGVEVVQTTIDLIGTYGAASAANTTTSGSAWTTPANAVGAPNGTVSTHNGSITPQSAILKFTFPDVPNKTALTITKVELIFYAAQGGTLTGNGNLQLTRGTRANPQIATLQAFTGNVDGLAAGLAYDVTAAYPTWASLGDVGAAVNGPLGAGATITQSVDAVVLRVTATRTDTL